MNVRSACVVLISTTLSACVTSSPSRTSGLPPEQTAAGSAGAGVVVQPAVTAESTAPAEPLPQPIVRQRTLTPASKALVAQAQSQLKAGNEAMAAATVERALRIEPDNPLLWIELAKVRQEEGNAAQAENLARKALAMAAGDGKTQAAAWRVIADSYRARGRNPEARDAEAKAQALGG